MTRQYTVVLTPEPEGGFTITVPALPGYIGFAETENEALALAKEGIRFHIESLITEGQTVPEEIEPPRILRLSVAA
ncbi:MAG TPA: type II toxin-antitoxin system HicB family antitoxin [Armatimonadota bacterium]|jgi:antitoxin HicB|nr:type II toxin-antitoxin system HicB family antitoxin [Armatimonadota bacterium]